MRKLLLVIGIVLIISAIPIYRSHQVNFQEEYSPIDSGWIRLPDVLISVDSTGKAMLPLDCITILHQDESSTQYMLFSEKDFAYPGREITREDKIWIYLLEENRYFAATENSIDTEYVEIIYREALTKLLSKVAGSGLICLLISLCFVKKTKKNVL